MNKKDIIFALICGLAVAWIALDFLGIYGWIFFLILPLLSIIGLRLAELVGKKFLFVHQAGKFALAGAFADAIDIKVFQLLFWLAPFSLLFKAISFLGATFVKYWWNRYWAFEKIEKDGIKKEALYFFAVTLVGLILNVGSFYYFIKILGAQFSMQVKTWTELSIIFSALVSAIWNFCGYKFFVFKK